MCQLHEVIEYGRELFLPGSGICLEPTAIFWNLGTQRWEFLYIPGKGSREEADIQREREQLVVEPMQQNQEIAATLAVKKMAELREILTVGKRQHAVVEIKICHTSFKVSIMVRLILMMQKPMVLLLYAGSYNCFLIKGLWQRIR